MFAPHVRQRTDAARVKTDRYGSGISADATTFTRRQIMARKLLTVLMALALIGPLSAISGCNTVAGAGKDIERGGEKVQDSARDVQRKL
jgi:entericidin B